MSVATKPDIKTDNSYLADKVGLRVKHLPQRGPIVVLDCFAGSGRIWRAVKRRTNREIVILGMDKRQMGFNLPGDNLAWLAQLDLSRFNVIDLDAYGVPYEQLKIIFDRGYRGIVFVTFIQSIWGQMPFELMMEVGFTESMLNKAVSLCSSRGWEYFREYISKKGVERIWHRSHARKHYLAFIL